MKIAVACDHGGLQLKNALIKNMEGQGYEVVDCSSETSGFGSKVAEEPFISSVKGTNIGDSVDTISGATISSSAVVDGINQAADHYAKNFK